MSVDIVLKNGRSGYDAVEEYVEKYWKQNGYATAIVSLETSYDGREYRRENEVVSPTEDFEACEFLNDWWEGEEYIRLIGIINVHEIDIFHTADVVEVRHGKWHYPPYAPFGGSYEMKRCSICGHKPDFDAKNPYSNFCPNCGAKMDGERREL